MDNTKSKHFWKTERNLDNAKVCDNFDLSYHLGTAVTYLLRSKRKHDSPIECLQKAINHIQFEIENYEEKSRS